MHIAGRRAMLALLIASLPACAGQTVGTASTSASPGRAWTPADSASAHAAAAGFLTAFDSLQWDRFRSFLSDDITMFFPFTDAPARVDGRAAVEEAFSGFFADRVKEGATSLGIVPRLLRVQMAGADAAVVSFELGASSPSRRSVVFSRNDGADWKVLHWHASPAPQRPQTAPAGRPLSPEEIAVYEGTYLIQVGERTLEITVSGDGDHLQVQRAGQSPSRLVPTGDVFVLQSDVNVEFVFIVVDGRAESVVLRQPAGAFEGSRKR